MLSLERSRSARATRSGFSSKSFWLKSASASEILSGAIQDHDVGLVAGTPTWGKGLVQTVYNLSYGAGIALTAALVCAVGVLASLDVLVRKPLRTLRGE